MAKSGNIFTVKELLIRIDERQKLMVKRMDNFERMINKKADTSDLEPYCAKTDKMWDERNRIVGWIVGGGLTGGVVSQVLGTALRAVLAMF